MSSGSGWYAFVIETKDDNDSSWWWISSHSGSEGPDPARGIRDQVDAGPADFARAALDGYLDHLVTTDPDTAEYWLYEDEGDTAFRIRVWDIVVASEDYAPGADVPDPDSHTSRQYPLALSAAKLKPDSVVTLPGHIVRGRLAAKVEAHQAAKRAQEQTTS